MKIQSLALVMLCFGTQAFAASPYVQKFCMGGNEVLTLTLDTAKNKVAIDLPEGSPFPKDWAQGLKLGKSIELSQGFLDDEDYVNKPKSKAISGVEYGVSADNGISYGIELIKTEDKKENMVVTGVYLGESCN